MPYINRRNLIMEPVAFRRLPFLTRFATMLSFFIAWVAFAEFVIDREGWDKHLPFYRYGSICVYEVAVIGLLAVLWIFLHRRKG
jgi:hypothetical protein